MIPEWPDDLRKFERDAWQVQAVEARRKRQGEAGPPGYRRRYSSVPRLVGVSIVLSRNEKAVFDQFYHVTCAEGSRNFWMPDPSTDRWALLASDGSPMLTGDGAPILMAARWLCAWGDLLPVESMDGDVDFRKEFQVVVLP